MCVDSELTFHLLTRRRMSTKMGQPAALPHLAEKGATAMSYVARGLSLGFLVAVFLMAITNSEEDTQAGLATQGEPPKGMTPTSTPALPSPTLTATASATPWPGCGPAWTISNSQNLGYINDYLNDVAIHPPYADVW